MPPPPDDPDEVGWVPGEYGEFRNESVERIYAQLLVERIKDSPGGYKLSMEMIIWLAVHFEDAFLPGEVRTKQHKIHEAADRRKKK